MNIYVKHKKIWNSILCVMLMTFMVLAVRTTVYGASANVSISSSTVTQGEEFVVVITVKADANIGAYNFYLDYDANVIEAVSGFEGGGNGRIQLMAYAQSTDVSKETTIKVTFKAKSPGTSSLKYISISEDNGIIDFDSADNMSVTATGGSVTVKAPYVASTNNYLSSLKVEAVKADGSTYSLDLSPEFSKDVTKYYAEAVEGVTKLVVSADKEDSKASIKTSGTKMDPGDNTTTITVTAEDGSTKKYVIYTTVAKPPETTTAPPEPIVVQIDGTDSYIEDINDSVTLPEGFETFEYSYKDKTVVAAKGLVKNLIVMYVTKGDGSAGQLYIYEEDTDTFYPMSNVQITQKLYTIVRAPEDIIIPAGFSESSVTIGEATFEGWVNSEVENIYLIYAMNWNGEKGLYYYDANEEQIIRYFDIAVQAGVAVDDYNSLLSENEKLKDDINKLKADNNNEEKGSIQFYKYLALGCCIMAAVYLGIIIYLVVHKKKGDDEVEAIDDEEEIDDVETEEVETEEVETEEVETEEVETEEVETEEVETEEVETEEVETEEVETEEVEIEEVETEEVETGEVEIEENVTEENETETEATESDDMPAEETEIEENSVEEVESIEEIENVEEVESMEEIENTEEVEATDAVETKENVSESIQEEVVVEMPADELAEIDDEQDEIDEMLLDFEDIITSDVEAIIEEEKEASDSGIQIENVEFSEEIEPETNVIQHYHKEENGAESIAKMVSSEEEAELEEAAVEDESNSEFTVEDKKKKVAEIMEDKNSSINSDDLDMVIDELFDDLFG